MSIKESSETEIKPEEEHFYTLSSEEVLSHLSVEENGLTSDEARRRIEHYGLNQLAEAPRPGFRTG